MSKVVRFYFSFRSPYSWLAFYRISKLKDQLPVDINFIPCYPSKEFLEKHQNDPTKMTYSSDDVKRFTEAYGLELKWPKPFDTDWIVPHAAFLYAEDEGKNTDFGLAAYAVRFSKGLDIGSEDVLRDIAAENELDVNDMLQSTRDVQYKKRVMKGMAHTRKDKMFGVPFFIYNDQRYWGNDRLEWLVRDIYHDQGKALPDLSEDPFLRPF